MSYYRSQVIDDVTGEGLQSVTITIDGTPVGVTDQAGEFYIDTQVQGTEMTFSYVGYNNQNIPLDEVNGLLQIGMTRQDVSLPAVTVTAKAPTGPVLAKKDYTPYIIAGAAGLILFGSVKHRKTAGVGKLSTGAIIAMAAGGGLLIYLLTRPKPAPVMPAQPVYSPYYAQASASASNPVAQDISAGATGVTAVSNLVSAISNL